MVDRPHFCENSRQPASTDEHYHIHSGEDLATKTKPNDLSKPVLNSSARAEKSEEKRHTLEIVNAVVASQQEIVKALRENGRELRAVLGAVQTLANGQKSMRQCFESFKREL